MMDVKAAEMLSGILAKPIGIMTENEKAIIRARRSYLTEAQIEDLKEVLEEKVPVKVENQGEPKKLEEMTKAELQKLCEDAELSTNGTKQELIARLRDDDAE
jgi:hypothetical protein